MVEEHEKDFLLSTDFGNKFPQFVNVVLFMVKYQ